MKLSAKIANSFCQGPSFLGPTCICVFLSKDGPQSVDHVYIMTIQKVPFVGLSCWFYALLFADW
jgi:hypothetical protein